MKPRHYLLLIIVLLAWVSAAPGAQGSPSLEARVRTVLIDPGSQTPVVILEIISDKKSLPIWIDVPEARAIALELEHVSLPRPLTHDLIRSILHGVGATLQSVTITELRNSTYFANLSLATKEKVIHLDSRPSDAVPIPLRMKAPIFVSTQVLAKAKPVPGGTGSVETIQRKLGLQTQDLTPELAKFFESQRQKGVLVTDVAVAGPASKAGLERGDIIAKANEQAIASTRELETALQAAKSPQLNFQVIKKGKSTTIVIDLPW